MSPSYSTAAQQAQHTTGLVLVRYGTVPEVARCDASQTGPLQRGERVVIQTPRGEQLATVLDRQRPRSEPVPVHLAHLTHTPPGEIASFDVLRRASQEDEQQAAQFRARCEAEFPEWVRRIQEWKLNLQLIDLEFTLDGKRILYVLNNQGPDCTSLALRAAAAGLGIIAVQPVSAEGLVTLPASMSTNPSQCGAGGSCGCASKPAT